MSRSARPGRTPFRGKAQREATHGQHPVPLATDGQHVKARSYSETIWKPALVKAGVIAEPAKDRRGRRRYITTRREGIHQLRHYYASVMLAGGVSIKELAEYLGHSDPAFTLRVYAHMLPCSHDRARAVISERFTRVIGPDS
jgi:integrase